MLSLRKFRFYGSTALGLAVALVVAACGSSSSSHHSSKHAASSTPTSTNASATSTAVKTVHSPLGTILVGPNGRTLYLWVADSMNKSNCSGACAKAWPPLTTTGKAAASGGAMSADLGTIARSGGTKQVTYKGHPLYYFIGDTAAHQVKGQGSTSFGAKWWVVAPSGAAITKAASSKSSSSGSSGGSSGGGWG